MHSNNQKFVDDAAEAPSVLFDVSTNSTEGRSPGLVLTKEQIISLRLYELAGLALPTTLRDVENYLTYKSGGGKGLEPVDFLTSFTLIKSHASRWDYIRSNIKLVGSQLKIFAGDIQIYGDTMNEIEQDIKALNRLDEYNIRTLEDVNKLKLELGDKFPGIELDKEDQQTVGEFADYLNRIFQGIQQRQQETEIIKSLLDNFSADLDRYVLPEIQTKVKLIDTSKLAPEIKALDEEIKARSIEIEELDKAYSESVKKSIGSAFGGVAGLAMAIYTGVEAEKIRKERNALKEVQSQAIRTLEHKQHVLGALHRVKLDMQDLELVVVDAAAATHNLRTVWNSLYLYIEASLGATKQIHDALTVRGFMTEFRRVVRPWVDIERDAGLLLDVFAAAEKELRDSYGDKK